MTPPSPSVVPSIWPLSQPFALGALYALMAAMVTAHALLRKRDVASAIGWIGMAWLAPVLGTFLYVCFGVNRVKRRARRLKGGARAADTAPARGPAASASPIESLKVAVGSITGQDLAVGEAIEILDCGDEGYPRMLAAIDDARLSVTLASYIFRDDDVGRQFIEALTRAHRRGARVRVLIDGFGGGFLRSPAYRRLRAGGVSAARFLHSTAPWRMAFLNLRLHKKSLVVDGRIAFIGGLNIGAENVLASHPTEPVRDHHFVVRGAIVRQIAQQFDDDWAFATGDTKSDPPAPPDPSSLEGPAARVIVAGPDQEIDQLVLVLLSAINLARRSIRIATPYFLPDEQLVTALQLATLRGVRVDLVLPSVNNHRVVAWAAQTHIRPLLRTGCHLWRSPPPFDHSKLMTVDGQWSLVGSANWDMRSLRLNFELTVEFYDADFAERLTKIIDARRAAPITLREIDDRPFTVKLRDAAARLAMPYI